MKIFNQYILIKEKIQKKIISLVACIQWKGIKYESINSPDDKRKFQKETIRKKKCILFKIYPDNKMLQYCISQLRFITRDKTFLKKID